MTYYSIFPFFNFHSYRTLYVRMVACTLAVGLDLHRELALGDIAHLG